MFQDIKFIKKLFIVVTSYPFPVNSVGIMPHGYTWLCLLCKFWDFFSERVPKCYAFFNKPR